MKLNDVKNPIKLVEDTIDNEDIDYLIDWLKTKPYLTKGKETLKFEKKWSKWLGCKHSVYVNSGSSANLAMIYALKCSGRLKSDQIIVPAVSWATTVSPLIQLGFKPILVECDGDTLGVDVNDLEKILDNNKLHPSALIMVHVLGFPCKAKEIQALCVKYGIHLLEDSCETLGSTYNDIKTGNFGIMSTFSFYFGHHMSTIEGGMICTNDDELYKILVMIRSHGWSRDLPEIDQNKLRKKHGVSEFKNLYSFYYPGFNLRSTDLQAYIGIRQIDKLKTVCEQRYLNFLTYDLLITNDYWKINYLVNDDVSNFAYPIIHPKRDEISKALIDNNIETRPLVCGSMENQPFCKDEIYYKHDLPFAKIVDEYGLYVPNHSKLTVADIERICNVINGVING